MGIINSESSAVPQPEEQKAVFMPVKTNLEKLFNTDERQKLIQRQGAIQHAMTSQAVFSHSTNQEEWWSLVEKYADKAVEYINRR